MDDIGSKGCMSAEREEIVETFGYLRDGLNNLLSNKEKDIVLTTFCQEFERRVAQKRKGRAGRGVGVDHRRNGWDDSGTQGIRLVLL